MNGNVVRALAEPLRVVEVHLHALTRLAENLEVIRGDIEWSRREVETAKAREGLGALAAQASKLRRELREDIASLQAALERTRHAETSAPIDVAPEPLTEEGRREQEDGRRPEHSTPNDLMVWKALNKAHERLSNLEARLEAWDRRERDAQRLMVALQEAQAANRDTLLGKVQSLATSLEALGKELHAFIAEQPQVIQQYSQELRDALEDTAARVRRHWRVGLLLLFLLFLVAAVALVRPLPAWW